MDGDSPATPIPDDIQLPFQIETGAAKGRLVRLGGVTDDVLRRHDYPEPVAALLAEMMALAVLVSGALKFDGIFTLQAKGNGPVNMIVADITTDGAMRGYAQFDRARLDESADAAPTAQDPVPRLLGTGYLAFTVDQGPDTERYQGIVELTGGTLADCAHHYFRQSDQLEAAVKLAVGKVDGVWRAAGIMLQRLAAAGRQSVSGETDDALEDNWRRAVVFMGSSTSDELIAPDLHPHELLFRLFHEDGVRVFEPTAIEMRCRCSREKVSGTLASFPRGEIDSLKEDGRIVVTCEFCGERYEYDDHALDALFTD